ncbi:TRASH domain-containing protein [Pedobacter jamesrossensis]|uniref:TRASH domain-containing protein n=1 Tax=Pedobacter jamesrossensis TaxID=1908238 RepID=A0ABV8NHP7_9SPHI
MSCSVYFLAIVSAENNELHVETKNYYTCCANCINRLQPKGAPLKYG